MPNRIIKESICTSDEIDQLSAFEETVFVRLLVNCDDFGRFDARPKIVSSRLFPLKTISPEEMTAALDALVDANLITIYEVYGKPYLHVNTWEEHQQTRATKSKYPAPDDNCNQLKSDDSKCPRNRNRNRNTIFDNRNRKTNAHTHDDDNAFISDDEAHRIQDEQNRVLDAAEDAGFLKSNSVRAKLLQLFAVHGLDKMLAAFDSCVKHGAPNLAYLEAVLKGEPKKQKPLVAAQDYGQRDYSGVVDELADEQARLMDEFKSTG
jgi:hypothetical protein